MALPSALAALALEDDANWAVERATGLPEIWALVAEHRGVVGAWQLMRVCKAARAGATEFLRTLPGLVVCGGRTAVVMSDGRFYTEVVSDVWRLDLATLRWEPMPALVTARYDHACCAVRGTLVVLGGVLPGSGRTSSVEMLSSTEEGGAFADLPPLSCGGIEGAAAIAVDESDSAAGQVLLLGGIDASCRILSTVQLVDLATGVCARQPDLLHTRAYHAAARLPDGRIVCAGGFDGAYVDLSSAEVWGPPGQGRADAAWTWIELSAMGAGRYGCSGCVMSDSRFAVLGGVSNGVRTSSCEALSFGDDVAHWAPLPPMHDARAFFACEAVAGCVIAAGGRDLKSAELYDEKLDRWLRLPYDLPYESSLESMGSALV
jgi:hypothetical protein